MLFYKNTNNFFFIYKLKKLEFLYVYMYAIIDENPESFRWCYGQLW